MKLQQLTFKQKQRAKELKEKELQKSEELRNQNLNKEQSNDEEKIPEAAAFHKETSSLIASDKNEKNNLPQEIESNDGEMAKLGNPIPEVSEQFKEAPRDGINDGDVAVASSETAIPAQSDENDALRTNFQESTSAAKQSHDDIASQGEQMLKFPNNFLFINIKIDWR